MVQIYKLSVNIRNFAAKNNKNETIISNHRPLAG